MTDKTLSHNNGMKVIEGIPYSDYDNVFIGEESMFIAISDYEDSNQKVRITIEPIPNYGGNVCPNCKYLGFYKGCDLYYCSQGGMPTLIAHTEEESDYKSGMFMKETDVHIMEAYKRAKAKGLV